jgi:hypothetical protein
MNEGASLPISIWLLPIDNAMCMILLASSSELPLKWM